MQDKPLLIELIKFLFKWKRTIVVITIVPTIIVVVLSFAWRKGYEATTTLIPSRPPANSTPGAWLSQSAFGRFAGLIEGIEGMSDVDRLKFILKSETIAREVIKDLNLQPHLYPSRWDNKNQQWKKGSKPPTMNNLVGLFHRKVLTVKAMAEGLITVRVIMPEANLAAMTANRITEALQNFINHKVLTIGKKNRIFVEQQLEKTREDLAIAEQRLQEFEEKEKIYDISSQTAMTLQIASELKADIIKNNVKLAQIEKVYGRENASYKQLILENASLKRQMRKIEAGSYAKDQTTQKPPPLFGRLENVPEVKVDYFGLKRNVLVLEKVYAFLKEQYEIVKVNELRDEISFQVIDAAVVPDGPAWPKKKLLAILSLFCCFMLGSLIAFIAEHVVPDVRKALAS